MGIDQLNCVFHCSYYINNFTFAGRTVDSNSHFAASQMFGRKSGKTLQLFAFKHQARVAKSVQTSSGQNFLRLQTFLKML